MIDPRIILATFAVVALCSCATTPRDPNDPFNLVGMYQQECANRQKAYGGLLSFLERGMTRRQLYALLPPRRTPTIVVGAVDLVFVLPRADFQNEFHPLDADFALHVTYHPNQTRSPRTRHSRPSQEDMNDLLDHRPILIRVPHNKSVPSSR